MLSDAELLDLVEAAKEGRKGDVGPRGPVGVGIAEINQPSPTELVFVLSDGSTKRVSLPVPKDGEPGEVGPQGEKGQTGSPGKDGRDGADALPGRDGKDGAPGAPGLQIESAVVTEEGRLLIGLSDDNVINAGFVRGEKGDKGERGFTGPIGDPGKDGNTILSGDRAPVSSDGNDGDFWIDLSASDLAFYGKTDGQWFKVAGLKQDFNARNNMLGTPMGGGGGGGGTPVGGFKTSDIQLERGSRTGLPPVDFASSITQYDWNWVAENDLITIRTSLQLVDARLKALEEVAGKTLVYDCEGTTGAAPSGSGFFTVNTSNPAAVTQIQLGSLDKNGELPQTPVNGDTLLFIDKAGTGIEHRYIIDDASGGLSNLVVQNTLTSGDTWVAGVEFETYLFPTNKAAVVVDTVAPATPDLGAIWVDAVSLIWYCWVGTWVPAHLPPSMEARITAIETSQAADEADILALQTEMPTKISEADGDARYLQLSGGTLTGAVTSEKKIIVDAPRVSGAPTNSFIVKGKLGGVDSQSLLYDYKPALENSLDSKVVYKGAMADDDEIVTKAYVDGIAGTGTNPSASYNVTSTGNTWYKLIDLVDNDTYEVLVQLENAPNSGSASLTVGVDGFPTRDSFIKVNQVVGTGSYQFRISGTKSLDVKLLDTGTTILKTVITGDSNNTSGVNIIVSEEVSSSTTSFVETPDVANAKAGGTYTVTGRQHILDYNDQVQLANVADPTDGTMVGNRDYNDARYLNTDTGYAGGSWPLTYNQITIVDALKGINSYRKIVVSQIYNGNHTNKPGWGLRYGSSRTLINFHNDISSQSVGWMEGSGNPFSVFSVNKSTITNNSMNYLADSATIQLVVNDSIDTNKVGAGAAVQWEFEFFKGNSVGPESGWNAKVLCQYINTGGKVQQSWSTYNCTTISITNLFDLKVYGTPSTNTWGRWQIVADY